MQNNVVWKGAQNSIPNTYAEIAKIQIQIISLVIVQYKELPLLVLFLCQQVIKPSMLKPFSLTQVQMKVRILVCQHKTPYKSVYPLPCNVVFKGVQKLIQNITADLARNGM